jgi:hypothetical protein
VARKGRSRADDRSRLNSNSTVASIRRFSRTRGHREHRRRHLRLPIEHLRVGSHSTGRNHGRR